MNTWLTATLSTLATAGVFYLVGRASAKRIRPRKVYELPSGIYVRWDPSAKAFAPVPVYNPQTGAFETPEM